MTDFLNTADPLLMHVDLNSAFSILEQQANPLIRNKPVVVAAYNKPFGAILSPSVEAKRIGIKMGMRVQDAQMICPSVIVRTPDPPKYREAHDRFMKIFLSYSPDVTAKSIDEAIINFTKVKTFYARSANTDWLISIAKEIKARIRKDLGNWVSCSIGIAPNYSLAKLGASLHKPDGLTVITHKNLRDVLKTATLLDLCGINVHYQLRLNRYGIYTPLQFLEAPLVKLQKQVFKSIGGYYWYMRLRGWEIDDIEFARKSFGQQYHLTQSSASQKELTGLLMKLCEKMGRRLRKANQTAKGIHVACSYNDKTYWHHGQTFQQEMYTTHDLFQKALVVFNQQPERKIVTKLAVQCFSLSELLYIQADLFTSVSSLDSRTSTDLNYHLWGNNTEKSAQEIVFEKQMKMRNIAEALDEINDQYGEYVIHPALMMNMKNKVIDRIAFGKSGIETNT